MMNNMWLKSMSVKCTCWEHNAHCHVNGWSCMEEWFWQMSYVPNYILRINNNRYNRTDALSAIIVITYLYCLIR